MPARGAFNRPYPGPGGGAKQWPPQLPPLLVRYRPRGSGKPSSVVVVSGFGRVCKARCFFQEKVRNPHAGLARLRFSRVAGALGELRRQARPKGLAKQRVFPLDGGWCWPMRCVASSFSFFWFCGASFFRLVFPPAATRFGFHCPAGKGPGPQKLKAVKENDNRKKMVIRRGGEMENLEKELLTERVSFFKVSSPRATPPAPRPIGPPPNAGHDQHPRRFANGPLSRSRAAKPAPRRLLALLFCCGALGFERAFLSEAWGEKVVAEGRRAGDTAAQFEPQG